MEITITRGLAQLTLLDKRIAKKIANLKVVAAVKNNSDVVSAKLTKEDFIKDQRAEYTSILGLMELRADIKSKIVVSNALTYITVGTRTYTVAEAIERKNSIMYERSLLTRLTCEYGKVADSIERQNGLVEDRALEILRTLAGKENKNVKVQEDSLASNYMQEQSYSMVDPLDVKREIADLDHSIDAFLSNVDFALSESNATTKITLSTNLDSF